MPTSIPLPLHLSVRLRRIQPAAASLRNAPHSSPCLHPPVHGSAPSKHHTAPSNLPWSSPRPISTPQLHALLHFHPEPIYLIVSKGSYFFTNGISHLEGGFTLRCLQRLSLPDLATLPWRWSPTGTPAVRPSRSSRTKDSSSQISCACAG